MAIIGRMVERQTNTVVLEASHMGPSLLRIIAYRQDVSVKKSTGLQALGKCTFMLRNCRI